MSITDNIEKIKQQIGGHIKLVAVSKTKPVEIIREAYDTSHRIFGENRVQELESKWKALPDDIEWHMIGHLQTNKVKYIAPFVYLIHSVDSLKLLSAVNKEAIKLGRTINILFQVKIAREESKYGFNFEDLIAMIESEEFNRMKNIQPCGLMGMATFSSDEDIIRNEFKQLKSYYVTIKNTYFRDDRKFCEISMGMSSDYKIAVEEGATIVRIGSGIFGERIY
jgi:PLP dependent protein